MKKEIENYTEKLFEDIKHIDEYGNEYWSARELGKVLNYGEYRKFLHSIKKAIISCEKSEQNVDDHFAQVDEMVKIGSNARRKLKDYRLTRYACYLIVQNSDSSKSVVALGQTYFAIQTRKQELLEEDEVRLLVRNSIRKGNADLNKVAKKAGVKRLDVFHNAGYRGLYNGETADDIFKRKKLRYREDILDHMGSIELGANIFRITQTIDRLTKENIDNEYDANATHYNVGRDIRKFIKKSGNTMPEDLPTPIKSIKELESNELKKISGGCRLIYS